MGRCKAWCIITAGAASLRALTKHLTKEEAFVLARGLREHNPSWQGRHCSGPQPGSRDRLDLVLALSNPLPSTKDSSPYSAATELGGLLPHGPLPGYALTDMSKSVAD